ncbi:lytic transglycosylase domain-containing protein [Pseudoprimorskyibacter insulae]|nr:lytic transglycosylase domain-containing protein [Pseudoprimorskyibacter insulae]
MTLAAAAALCAFCAAPILAEGPKPFPDFSAKRVKPPSKTAKKRITVQIEPVAAVKPAAPSAPLAEAPGGGASARYDWFWQTVSPALADTGPGRLEPALNHLNAPPSGKGVAAPRLQALQDIAQRHGVDILKSSIGTKVSPALALAVISVESGGAVDAQSGAGAQGLMQLMPATATRFGVEDSFDAAQNISGGVKFLDFLMEKFQGDPILVLAGYNAGENSIANHGGVPPFAETRDYVPKVLAAFSVARGLCMTPPELVSDGCVFRRMDH